MRVGHAMLRYALCLHNRTRTIPLAEWAQARWQDIALGVHWLLDHGHTHGHGAELRQLLARLHAQGIDWEGWFETLPVTTGPGFKPLHGVNNAQALKTAAVLRRHGVDPSLERRSRERVAKLDGHCGLPTGMWISDENMPTREELETSHHHPSRGAELCGVVEAMFSFSVMFAAFGDPYYLDRLERIAFNALPATWASPRGGEMIAHQFVQQVNQIEATNPVYSRLAPKRFPSSHPGSNSYGIARDVGCCTANFNQVTHSGLDRVGCPRI
jgi:uncharacterized protein